MPGRWLTALALLLSAASAMSQPTTQSVSIPTTAPWPQVFELNVGPSHSIAFGSLQRAVKLIKIEERRHPDFWIDPKGLQILDEAKVHLEIDGRPLTLRERPYESPIEFAGLRWYVESTRAGAVGEIADLGGMHHDLRLSAQIAGQAWGPTLTFPINAFRWRSSTYQNTWSGLVPYNKLYYHRGEDFGAIPDRLDVVAARGGTIVASPLPNGDGRSNAVSIDIGAGVSFRYAHMNTESIDPAIVVGAKVHAGQKLGKTGMTWSGRKSQTHDPHLHFALHIKSDAAETQLGSFPFLAEAYFATYPDPLLPIAGNYYFTLPGHPVQLDGSRSLARPGRKIISHAWNLPDGKTVQAPIASFAAETPGLYSAELIVKSDDGVEDRDYAQIRVWNPKEPRNIAYGWFYSSPARNIRPGASVLFWNRLVNSTDATIDFGDGTPPQPIKADATHKYASPGLYTATLKATGPANDPATVRLRVIVEAENRP